MGDRWGWHWQVRANAAQPTDTEQTLAAELVAMYEPTPVAVAAACLTPDAPALDYVSGDLGDR